MSDFEPAKLKVQLRSETGVEYFLAKSLEEAAANRALARGADMRLTEAIRCIFVGFDDEAFQLLDIAKEWLEYAIATQEENRGYFRYGTEASRHENLALCNWLLHDFDDQENLCLAVHFEDLYDQESRLSKKSIAIILPVYVDARSYDRALSLFEERWGGKKPANTKRIAGETAMSYVVAAAKLRREYDADQVDEAGQYFLRSQTAGFLERGNYSGLARWLKILHWNDRAERTSAFDAVRRCYDYLPNIARPNFR